MKLIFTLISFLFLSLTILGQKKTEVKPATDLKQGWHVSKLINSEEYTVLFHHKKSSPENRVQKNIEGRQQKIKEAILSKKEKFDGLMESRQSRQNMNQLKAGWVKHALDSIKYVYWEEGLGQEVVEQAQYFTYNMDGTLQLEQFYFANKEGVELMPEEKTEYSYTEDGILSLTTTYRWSLRINDWYTHSNADYDEAGNQHEKLIYTFDTITNAPVFSKKYIYDYNSNNKRINYENYNWDNGSSNWIGANKYLNDFDTNGNKILDLRMKWDTISGDWVNYIKTEEAYNSNGKTILYTNYLWDKEKNSWIGQSKSEYGYNENGLQIRYVNYYWDQKTMQWVSTYQRIKNEDLEIILEIDFDWSGEDQTYVGDTKYEVTFDENGNKTGEIDYEWDTGNSTWIYSEMVQFNYDLSNNLLSRVEREWDIDAGEWTDVYKNEYGYDETGNQISSASAYRDAESGEWKNSYRNISSYDAFGNQTMLIIQNWDTETDQWVNVQKNDSSFEENGNESLVFSQMWKDGEWVNYFIITYNYDENGNTIFMLSHEWAEETNSWINALKREERFDKNDKQTYMARYHWDNITGMWIGSERIEHTYSQMGYNLAEIEYEWNYEVNDWVPYMKEERLEDEFGYNVGERSCIWDVEKNEWAVMFGLEFQYDYNYTKDQLLLPFQYDDEFFHHMLTSYILTADFMGNMKESIRLYYSEINLTETETQILSETKVFPNPASSHVIFSWKNKYDELQLNVFDSSGKLVIDKMINKNKQVSVNQLKTGLYIYRLSNAGEIINTGKISIK